MTDWFEANQRALVAAMAEVKALLEGTPPEPAEERDAYRLGEVVAAFRLSEFERNVLVLCAAIELDSTVAALCADAQCDPARGYPTFSLALAVLPGAHWSAVTPEGALRRWHLVAVAGGGVLTQAPLRIDERVLHFLTGIDTVEARFRGVFERFDGRIDLAASQEEAAARAARWLAEPRAAVQLCGSDAATRRTIAAAAARELAVPLWSVSANALAVAPGDGEVFARLWEREAALTKALLYVECDALDGGEAPRSEALRMFLDGVSVPLLAGTRERRTLATRRMRTLDLQPPTATERRRLWNEVLGEAGHSFNGELDELSTHFRLSASAIRDAVHEVADSEAASFPRALWQSCRLRTRQRLDELARRIDARAVWDDLVLAEPQKGMLRDLASAVRYRNRVYERWGFSRRDARGLGVSALFDGQSGTGKTLAAEILAHELELDLYAIDLSGVVSKYIGETEKNLRRIFDAAEEGGAILLFDEADALFGKRSEVRDSHDRYANIEVSYLLQRMEAYRGIAILTTNLRDALDTAFLRRIRYVIQFPFPDAEQRADIWRRVFPPELPLDDVSVEKLSSLSIAGGNIRNVALSAAFLAARENGGGVRMSHLLHAARNEYTKLDRTLADSEVAGWV